MMYELAGVAVAKKKSKRGDDNRKPLAIQVRGSEEFKAWVEEFAALENDTVAKFIERVLRKHARDVGFRDIPPR